MTDEARFLKKKKKEKNWGLILGPTGLNQIQIEFFHHFLEFGSLDFLEMAYSGSSQQCQTSSTGKTHEKKF